MLVGQNGSLNILASEEDVNHMVFRVKQMKPSRRADMDMSDSERLYIRFYTLVSPVHANKKTK